jgi:hypothetical protein
MQISTRYLQFGQSAGSGKLCSASGLGAAEIRTIRQELGRIDLPGFAWIGVLYFKEG